MIWTVVVILTLVWLLGWLLEFGGNLIHLLLILIFVGLVYEWVVPRNRRVS